MFKDTEYKTPRDHVTGTMCRPDITAAFQQDWLKNDTTDWAFIQLAGEKASRGKSRDTQRKNAATYLHYLLLARPDRLVAQGVLTREDEVMFLLGIGGVGIKELTVPCNSRVLYKLLYAFIYRLYCPSRFSDESYIRTDFNGSEATYTVCIHTAESSGFRPIHARNPFATRTHVLSKPPSKFVIGNRPLTVLKEQLIRRGRRFNEWDILFKIHRPNIVPGVVEAVYHETIVAPLAPGRQKYRLGLQQTGSPFTRIPTAMKMLETLFDLLEGI